jgi:hypothetical protein
MPKMVAAIRPDGGRNGEQNFRGKKRSNQTHESTTDPHARLYRKGNGQRADFLNGPCGHGKLHWPGDLRVR